MSEEFEVSVIIPVYNAKEFVEKAVQSVLEQNETCEAILVDDGSTDGSYDVCIELACRYPSVTLVTHEGRANLGVGAARNLGIERAKFELIAFLDADDFFLPGRFDADRKVFAINQRVDGVYNALGLHVYSQQYMESYFSDKGELTTLHGIVPPEELFFVLTGVHSVKGHFSLVGFTVRKHCLMDIGMFNPTLRLHQDTDLLIRLSANYRLFPGELTKPVALRGVHTRNRISQNNNLEETRYALSVSLRHWAREAELSDLQSEVLENYCYAYELVKLKKSTVCVQALARFWRSPAFFLQSPFFSKVVRRLLGKNFLAILIIRMKGIVQEKLFRIPAKSLRRFWRPCK